MANAIKRIRIEGFKKFKSFDLEFDPCMNILIGENESGKSTILDAIKLVLCQEYRTADKAYLFDLFNHDLISKHKKEKSYGSLPVIKIEIEFDLDGKGPYAQDFWGCFCQQMLTFRVCMNGASYYPPGPYYQQGPYRDGLREQTKE